VSITAGACAAALLSAACGSRTGLALTDFVDGAQTDRVEPPVDGATDVTVVDVAAEADHATDDQADVFVAQEAATDASEDSTLEASLGEGGDGSDSGHAMDAADAIEEIDAVAGDASDAACTAAEPSDYANWHVSDVPQQLVENADDTITDNATGLTWMRGPAGEVDGGSEIYATSFAEAQAACQCPWRLPQRIELLSIVDYSRYDMALNPLFIARAADGNTAWTVTPYLPSSTWWFVDLIKGAPWGPYGGFVAGQVRCVRGTTQAPAVRYTLQTSDAGVAEVVDNGTGLTWKQQSEPGTSTLDGALVRCAAPYRTPTVSELHTLVDSSRSDPAIDTTFFGDTGSDSYVSSTPVGSYYLPGYHWYVDFSVGQASYDNGGFGPYQVRCVR
jgi:hypothetical protein